MDGDSADPTMPAVNPWIGCRHPIDVVLDDIAEAFVPLGFAVHDLPLLEHSVDNFDRLGFPPEHPNQTRLSFRVGPDAVFRSHTTSGCFGIMRAAAPEPVRALLIGSCFRNEAPSPASNVQFTQLDGVAVQPGLGMPDLCGLLEVLVDAVIAHGHPWRLRQVRYPFTAPGFAVDVRCPRCTNGCQFCRGRGWAEIGAGGLLTDDVIAAGGYRPDEVRAVSFGCSVERLIGLRHGLDDIRELLLNDPRLLEQFGGRHHRYP
jgi:phenylalanyl-tRNA synthetase alpha chain